MAWPSGVSLCTYTFGSALGWSGRSYGMRITLTTSHAAVWAATGQPVIQDTLVVTCDPGMAGSFQVPHVDQEGFTVNGSNFTSWGYQARIEYIDENGRSVGQAHTKALHPEVGQDVIDLDLVPDGAFKAPVYADPAPVLSVEGQTGHVTLAGLRSVPPTDEAAEGYVLTADGEGGFGWAEPTGGGGSGLPEGGEEGDVLLIGAEGPEWAPGPDVSEFVDNDALNAALLDFFLAGILPALEGKASLDGQGKIVASALPNLAIVEFMGEVPNAAAMSVAGGQRGDWCIRTDEGRVYVRVAEGPGTAAWRSLAYPVGLLLAALGDPTPGQAVAANDPRLSDDRNPTAHTHSIADITGLASTLANAAIEVHWTGTAWPERPDVTRPVTWVSTTDPTAEDPETAGVAEVGDKWEPHPDYLEAL